MRKLYNFLKVKLCYRTYWRQWLVFLAICFLLFACSSGSGDQTEENESNPQIEEVYAFNYNVPSHDWENYHTPWLDVYNIFSDLFTFDHWWSHVNTYYGVGDFNLDGHLDINTGIPVPDYVNPDYRYFVISDGEGNYYYDNDFPYESNIDVYHSRKTIIGDFNLDNKPDVFRPAGAHDYLSYPNIVLSTESGYTHVLVDAPLLQPHTVSSGDIDNDGDLDIFLGQSGEFDGFAINNGDGTFEWKWISQVITDFDSGFMYPDGNYGYYGIWSSEMTDVDNDGFVDLIFGGSYAENENDPNFLGPTVFWGDGSGNYYNANSTLLFNAAEINYAEGNTISLSHDYAVNDIDGDGIKDIAVFSECSDVWLYHIIKGNGGRQFEDKTADWLPNNIIYNSINHVWIKMMDVDNNGLMDLVEGEPWLWLYTGQWRQSIRWEWNGNGFSRIN